MNYSEMFDEWAVVLKRSTLAIHILCFVLGVLVFLSVVSMPYYYSQSPDGGQIFVALAGAILGFALLDAVAVAFRYAVWGDIKILPGWTLDAYFPSAPGGNAATQAPAESAKKESALSASTDMQIREGVSGVWDVEMDSSYGALPVVFNLAQHGTRLTGTVEGSLFMPMEIEEGTISGTVAKWKANASEPMPMTLEIMVSFDGDAVSGEANFGEYGDGKISGGRRGSAAAASGSDQDSGTAFAPVPLEPRRRESVPPEEITTELLPIVEELGLVENCRQLAHEGWTIIENAADPEFVARLRKTIVDSTELDASGTGGGFSVLGEDPVYAEAVLNPKVMAVAEFSVGRGFLLGSLISSIRSKGNPALELHSDEEMFPAPLPAHNMMLTACWVMEDFTKEGGATRVVPGTNRLLRHPTEEEATDESAGIAMECPAGSIAMWDGRVFHGNCARTIDGLRVVLHATYYRLLLRQGQDYSDVADKLIETYGIPMSTLLGREDYMCKKNYDYVKDYPRFQRTLNNAKS